MGAQGYYLYGVIQTSEERSLGAVGLEQQQVSTIPFQGIAAVVSPWAQDVVPATPENCLAHERVLGELIRTETLLPFEFGTVAPDREGVTKLLKTNFSRLTRALEKLSGMVEVNVTALWRDMKAIFQELVKGHPMIAHYRREILAKPYEQTYQDRLTIGQMVAEALETKKREEGEKLYRAIKKGAKDTCRACMGKPMGDNVIFTGAFLVKRDAYADFERRLLEVGQRYDGRVDFKYTDPLPPYHFVEVKIRV